MTNTKVHPASVSHDKLLVARLKRDPALATEYLNVAMEEATDDSGCQVLLAAMRQVAEAHGIANVARAAGIKRESLSRVLSAKGNPRFDTLCAVMHAMRLRLTVTPVHL